MPTAFLALLILAQTLGPPETRTIHGVVTAIGTMDAIPDAEIAVGIDKSDLDTLIAAFKYNQKFPMRTVSDNSGRFSVSGVIPGKYIVTVQRDGFFGKPPEGKTDMRDAVAVPVSVPSDQDGPEVS